MAATTTVPRTTPRAQRRAAGTAHVAGGVAVGSLGTLIFAVLGRDWNMVIAVGTTVAPAALAYLVGNGGIKGVLLSVWRGTSAPTRRRRANGRAAA
jgi:hypothetical protein